MKTLLMSLVLGFSFPSLAATPVKTLACGFINRVQSICILQSQSGNYYLTLDSVVPGPNDAPVGGSTTIVPVTKKEIPTNNNNDEYVYSGVTLQKDAEGKMTEVLVELTTFVTPNPSNSSRSNLKMDNLPVGGDIFLNPEP